SRGRPRSRDRSGWAARRREHLRARPGSLPRRRKLWRCGLRSSSRADYVQWKGSLERDVDPEELMNDLTRRIQRVYLTLQLGNTLAASFIWGINTLFLLDAGLSNLEAFAANAFFTVGLVLFEVPTGVVADMWGRRLSYLLGTLTLSGSTFLYWLLWVTN